MLDPRTSLVSCIRVGQIDDSEPAVLPHDVKPKSHTSQVRAGISRRVTKRREHGRLIHLGEVGVLWVTGLRWEPPTVVVYSSCSASGIICGRSFKVISG